MNNKLPSSTRKKFLWIVIISIFVVISIFSIQWATYARPPLPEAVAALQSDGLVSVDTEPWLTFTPTQTVPTTGFIFYPGGRIDPQGYAALMREIATAGYLVVVPEMPINMAVFNPNIADEIIARHPEIAYWAIGGHSVGGVMAAQYTNKHRETISGLVIWAAFPAGNANLADSDIPVVSIYGSLDPRVNEASITERKHLLPPDTRYIQIEGGGHHQFGAYQIKPEEHQASISAQAQHGQILQATLDLLNSVAGIR